MSNPFTDANELIDKLCRDIPVLASRLRDAGASPEIVNALYRVQTKAEDVPEFDDEGNIKG